MSYDRWKTRSPDDELAVGDLLPGWQVVSDRRLKHVVPLGDRQEHLLVLCWCGPRRDGDIIVHNSADRRELFEPQDHD